MPALELTPKLSRYFSLMMGAICLVSYAVLCYLPMPWWGMLAGFVTVTVYGCQIFREYVFGQTAKSVKKIECMQTGEWFLTMPSGRLPACLLGDSTVTRWLSVLQFKLANGCKQTVIIFSDAVTAEQYRRLLVQLNAI